MPNPTSKEWSLGYQSAQQLYQNKVDATKRLSKKNRKNETIEEMRVRLLNELFGDVDDDE